MSSAPVFAPSGLTREIARTLEQFGAAVGDVEEDRRWRVLMRGKKERQAGVDVRRFLRLLASFEQVRLSRTSRVRRVSVARAKATFGGVDLCLLASGRCSTERGSASTAATTRDTTRASASTSSSSTRGPATTCVSSVSPKLPGRTLLSLCARRACEPLCALWSLQKTFQNHG